MRRVAVGVAAVEGRGGGREIFLLTLKKSKSKISLKLIYFYFT